MSVMVNKDSGITEELSTIVGRPIIIGTLMPSPLK